MDATIVNRAKSVPIRTWAAQEPAVARMLRRADRERLRFVGSLFAEIGFTGLELEMRTTTFVVFHSMEFPTGGSMKTRRRLLRARHASYAVPFSCGPNPDGFGGVVPATYETAITVTNLNVEEARVRARYQLTDPRSPLSDAIHRRLNAGRSVLLDCPALQDDVVIQPVPFTPDSFNQGVLTIDSRSMLNVVVQTTATGPNGDIAVQSRQVPHQLVERPVASEDRTVEVCHIPPGNPDARHTIEVDESSVSAHLGHGDYLDECDEVHTDD